MVAVLEHFQYLATVLEWFVSGPQKSKKELYMLFEYSHSSAVMVFVVVLLSQELMLLLVAVLLEE